MTLHTREAGRAHARPPRSPASHYTAGLRAQRIPIPRGDDTSTPGPSASPLVLRARLETALTATELGIAVSTLDPHDPYVTAARLGVEVALGRDEALLLENYIGGRWHRPNPQPTYTELERRRYPPHGDRDEWVRYGPAGRPAGAHEGTA